MKLQMTTAAIFASASIFAVPEVSNVTFSQDVMSRRVAISYSLSAPAIVTLDILTNAVDETSGVSIGVENMRYLSGDVNRQVAAGNHAISWEADKAWPGPDGKGFKITDSSVRAKVTAWPLDNPPDVMVVDLIRAGGSSTYDVTYYTSLANLPGGLLANTEYRTSKLVMKRVRAPECGTYVMGNLKETGHRTEEYQHTVILTNDYYLGVFEVTQSQYKNITGSYPSSHFTTQRDMRPAEKITANGWRGQQYPNQPLANYPIGLLASRSGYAFDFPSETQFEYACRAGNYEGFWPDGSAIDLTAVNTAWTSERNLGCLARYGMNGYTRNESTGSYSEPSASVPPADGGTAEVGSYEPNSWGFYDMLGNVDEICLDFYKAANYADNGSVVPPSGADDSSKIAMRGVCYWDQWYNCRSSRRLGETISTAQRTHGCRLACPITPNN